MAAMISPSARTATGDLDLLRRAVKAEGSPQIDVGRNPTYAQVGFVQPPDLPARYRGDLCTDGAAAVQAGAAAAAVAAEAILCKSSATHLVKPQLPPVSASASGGESDTSTPPRQLATTAAAAAAAAAAAIAAVIDASSSKMSARLAGSGRGPPPLSTLSTPREKPFHTVSQQQADPPPGAGTATHAARRGKRAMHDVDGRRHAIAEPVSGLH